MWHATWIGPLAIFLLAWLLKQLRLWLTRRKTARAIREKARAEHARHLEIQRRQAESPDPLVRLNYQRAVARLEAEKKCRANPRGPGYKIEIVDDKVCVHEFTRKPGDPDVVIVPYVLLDGSEIEKQRALDAAERAKRPKQEHVNRSPAPAGKSLEAMIRQDKQRTADRDAWIRTEARRLAEENLDPVTRETLLAEGGQAAVDKALDDAVALALEKIAQGSRTLVGRMQNAENYVPDANRLRDGIMAIGKPLPDASKDETEPK